MPRIRLALAALAVSAVALSGCAAGASTPGAQPPAETAADGVFPVTVQHALGETVIPEQPERVATVAWANHEVPLALGIVPVGMSKATWGDDDGDGVLPWVEERLEELMAALDNDTLGELIARVTVEREQADDVAEEWLKEQGLVS